jgi:hypothetical protein
VFQSLFDQFHARNSFSWRIQISKTQTI